MVSYEEVVSMNICTTVPSTCLTHLRLTHQHDMQFLKLETSLTFGQPPSDNLGHNE
jgi:hypothetical protein